MSQIKRLAAGGLIDRNRPIEFTFNGTRIHGFLGDTVASSLLANNQVLMGRSFKYHRPRGAFTAGSAEPNALITVGEGAYAEPNTRATTQEIYPNLATFSQNHLGSLENDWMGVLDRLAPFLAAGFYYKTFMWPKAFWEKVYEPLIRRSAGLGSLSGRPDPAVYDKGFLHCDVLIIGAGAAGLFSALIAARSGARVILCDEDFVLGGQLNSETYLLNETSAQHWVAEVQAELESLSNVRILTRTTVTGAYDHGIYAALERCGDHHASDLDKPRQILWRIYSKSAILCAGSTERGIAFGNNDRPGVMLASAYRAYLNRYAVCPAHQLTIFTNNDDGWRTAIDFQRKNIGIAAVIDSRAEAETPTLDGVEVHKGAQILSVEGGKRVKEVKLSNGHKIHTDGIAVSGGWNPNVHLTCHHRGRPKWREAINAFVPDDDHLPPGMRIAGAAAGHAGLVSVLKSAEAITHDTLNALSINPNRTNMPHAEDYTYHSAAFWYVKDSPTRAWIDLQNDVTAKDIRLANQQGFESVELLKRYTTLGMATDQGKTANILGLAVLADCQGKTIPEVGTTIYRPPYAPIALGALAGRTVGEHFMPTRLTPSHQWAEEQGAVFTESGLWMRSQWFPSSGETHWRDSVNREVTNTRSTVGICDVTTLGKIDIQGRDAAAFLNAVYTNGFAKLPIGKVRYGLMLREDGIVMDDGTTARLAENHYVMTTTTAHAGLVFQHLEFARQALFPEMDVHLISTTDGWAQFAIAGPKSRALLEKLVDKEHNISNEAFPFMACAEISICGGIRARLFRISFSGELAYEIAVPTRYGDAIMRQLIKRAEKLGGCAYGLEALNVMRIEKGHVVASELNGTTTANNLNMAKMISDKKDSIGKVLAGREDLNTEDDLRLVGFIPKDRARYLSAGAHFLELGARPSMENDQGYMTSVAYSPELGHSIGIGFLKRGNQRIGETLRSVDLMRGTDIEVEITSAHFIDPEGERLRG